MEESEKMIKECLESVVVKLKDSYPDIESTDYTAISTEGRRIPALKLKDKSLNTSERYDYSGVDFVEIRVCESPGGKYQLEQTYEFGRRKLGRWFFKLNESKRKSLESARELAEQFAEAIGSQAVHEEETNRFKDNAKYYARSTVRQNLTLPSLKKVGDTIIQNISQYETLLRKNEEMRLQSKAVAQ